MSTSPLRDASIDFSVKIIKLCGSVRGHGALTNQLERSATSIGANLHEAQYAHGMADFTAKLRIALKECYETEYWLELFIKSEILPGEELRSLYRQCGQIRRMLVASLNTARGPR